MENPIRLSRRTLLALAARLGAGGAVAALWPASVDAQPIAGKDARMLIRSVRPPNYETPVSLLGSLLTPVEAFYLRCHMSVPAATDEASWMLGVDGEVATPLSIALADLKSSFEPVSVTVTLECAGNGRSFFDPPVAGVQWRKGAVGTAKWTGVRVSDVLQRAGAKASATHIWVSGADRPLGTQPAFVRQVPLAKALHRDTIIAWAMNDQPVPGVHGAPLRLVVPGWEGAYAVKWLNRIVVADAEHAGFWVATAYRYPTRRVAPGASVDQKDTAPLTGLAVKSLITSPLDGAIVKPGRVTVAGFAWAGEADIAAVDVSLDSGATWQPARLVGDALPYTWRRFELVADVSTEETHTILSRATDANGRVQPIAPQWNPSGYLWNAPDQVRVEVQA